MTIEQFNLGDRVANRDYPSMVGKVTEKRPISGNNRHSYTVVMDDGGVFRKCDYRLVLVEEPEPVDADEDFGSVGWDGHDYSEYMRED